MRRITEGKMRSNVKQYDDTDSTRPILPPPAPRARASRGNVEGRLPDHTARKGNGFSFDRWMHSVNLWLDMEFGVSSDDIDDYGYSDAYDNNRSAKSVARAAYRASGGPA